MTTIIAESFPKSATLHPPSGIDQLGIVIFPVRVGFLDNLHSQYSKLRQAVLSTKFAMPAAEQVWSKPFAAFGQRRNRSAIDTTTQDFELISAKAKELAVGSDLPRQNLSEAMASAEILRLRKFETSLAETLFGVARIAPFLANLMKPGSRPTKHASEWEELAEKAEKGRPTEIRAAMKQLATLLRAP